MSCEPVASTSAALRAHLRHLRLKTLVARVHTMQLMAKFTLARRLCESEYLKGSIDRCGSFGLITKYASGTAELKMLNLTEAQVRKMCGYCKLTVVDLCRIAIGPLQLGNLRQGEVRNLSQAELDNMMSAVGGWNIVEQKECESLSSRLQRPETLSTEEKAKIQEYLSEKG